MTFKHSWKHLLAIPCLTSLMATPALAAGKAVIPGKQELAAESRHMAGLLSAKGEESMRIDFADQAQYDFVVHRLLASGNTPENSPRLFARLALARQAALQGQADSGAAACVHAIEVSEQPAPGLSFYTGKAEVSCASGDRDYVFSDVNVYRESDKGLDLLAQRSAEDYRGGGFFDQASVNVGYRKEMGHSLQIDSLALAFDDARGSVAGTYSLVKPEGADARSGGIATLADVANYIIIEQPRNIVGGTPTPLARICLNRGLVTATNVDCDYATVENDLRMWPTTYPYPATLGMAGANPAYTTQWVADGSNVFVAPGAWDYSKTYMPIQGVLYAGTYNGANCTISGVTSAKAELRFQEADDPACGYAVNQLVGTANFPASVVTGGNAGSFRTLGDFGVIRCPATGGVLYEKKLKLTVQLNYTRSCPGTTAVSRYITKQHDLIVDFRNSCFEEGTQVLMADGSMKAIEQVKMGEKVVVDEKGTTMTVTGISRGGERDQMVRLVDDQGREVKVTSAHPVLTPKGVTQAQALVAGDQVTTRDGVATLTSVSRAPVKGLVYNLNVGTEEELKKAGKTSATLFANGFLMGDNRMQVQVQDAKSQLVAKASVSKAWMNDYRNDQARKAVVR